jgi:hypothetical protein
VATFLVLFFVFLGIVIIYIYIFIECLSIYSFTWFTKKSSLQTFMLRITVKVKI